MAGLSKERIKSIPPNVLLKVINRMKTYLKTNKIFKDMCEEYELEPDVIDLIPMKFGDLEVSARTANGIITLNNKLLQEGNIFHDIHYLLHEMRHVLDQCYGDHATPGADDGDYLHNPAESKAFKDQIQFLDDQYGLEEAERYVNHLLDHHDKSGKERENLKDTLMEKVDDI